jgi:hypothetical protein
LTEVAELARPAQAAAVVVVVVMQVGESPVLPVPVGGRPPVSSGRAAARAASDEPG